mmetsp:Transcript_15430/g.43404  ORF Transcript_15430/g.43404 Transcript_15430/m.43404 type:complete len:113 (-) Transcript_15430:126-464(-)
MHAARTLQQKLERSHLPSSQQSKPVHTTQENSTESSIMPEPTVQQKLDEMEEKEIRKQLDEISARIESLENNVSILAGDQRVMRDRCRPAMGNATLESQADESTRESDEKTE